MGETTLTILAVDDDAGDAELLRRGLERVDDLRFEFVHAASSRDALIALERRRVDVVFLDYLLGAESGSDVLERIRADGYDVPIVVLTGQGDPNAAAKLMRLGADDYLVKTDATPESLRQAVANARDSYRRRGVRRGPRVILVVDDDAGDAELLRQRLKAIPRLEFDFRHVFDSRAALDVLQGGEVDIVLLDYVLDLETGLDALHAIRDAGFLGPLIVVSGRGDEYAAINSMRAGADDFLVKQDLGTDELRRSIQFAESRYGERLAERSLEETDRKLQAIFDTAVDAIITIDETGAVESFNRSAERMFGYRRSEILGKNVRCIVPPPHQERHDDYIANYLRTGRASIIGVGREVEGLPKDGRTFPIHLSISEIKLRGKRLLTGILRDITAERRILDALQESNRQLEELNGELEALAAADGLTGLANRRSFDQRLESEWKRAAREQTEIALVMIDVDCFKAYNDSLGHLAGDDCLKAVATSLKASCRRPADLAARYGGEEFCLLLPHTESHGAVELADATRAAIKALALPHPGSSIGGQVTVSVGVATARPGSQTVPADLIAAADGALYRSKEDGRNRVTRADSPDRSEDDRSSA